MDHRQVMVITGASAGIGETLALHAARAGYALLAVGRNAASLTTLTERVKDEGGTIITLTADVRDQGSAARIARLAEESFGRIDVVVANAGIAGKGPLLLQSHDELAEQIETHLYAPLSLIQQCLPQLVASKGTAIVIGSGVARMPIGGMGLYPASKAALRSATRTLRQELRPLGVGLTYVDPGAVDTDFMRRRELPGAPTSLLTSPHTVAKRICAAITRRQAELYVVPWQGLLAGLGELFPVLTDLVLAKAGSITGAPLTALDSSRSQALYRLKDEIQSSASSAASALLAKPVSLATPTSATRPEPVKTAVETVDHSAGEHVTYPAGGLSAASSLPHQDGSAAAIGTTTATPSMPTKIEASASDTMPNQSGDESERVVASDASTPIADATRPAASVESRASAQDVSSSRATPGETVPTTPARRPARPARAKQLSEDESLDSALTALQPRMRKFNFSAEMIRARLQTAAELKEDDIALDWVGMPNKHERKLVSDICAACAEAGLLEAIEPGLWRVVRVRAETL